MTLHNFGFYEMVGVTDDPGVEINILGMKDKSSTITSDKGGYEGGED